LSPKKAPIRLTEIEGKKLIAEATIKHFFIVQKEGNRKVNPPTTLFYRLELISRFAVLVAFLPYSAIILISSVHIVKGTPVIATEHIRTTDTDTAAHCAAFVSGVLVIAKNQVQQTHLLFASCIASSAYRLCGNHTEEHVPFLAHLG
jgi:hypothetical protein